MGYVLKIKKIKYAGHIIRERKERWARRVSEWMSYGNKRGKGRPGTKWDDEIKNRVGSAWEREIWNREVLEEDWGGLCPGMGRLLKEILS